MKKVFVMIAAVALILAACKKDEDSSKTLYYKGRIVTEFKMYVGTPSGGKEVNLTGITPDQYWATAKISEDDLNGEFIKFGTNYFYNSRGDSTQYRISGDSIFTYEPLEKGWFLLGFGNTNKVTINSYLYGNNNYYPHIGTVTLQDVLKKEGFSSLSELTRETDTIRWANLSDTFE